MIRVVIEPMESNDPSNEGAGYLMSLQVNGQTVMSSTSQSYANVHDPIELAERVFGFGAGTSTAPTMQRTPDPAMEPVELVIHYATRPVETRRLR